jgi:starvation-inducible DNA-binding protein
MAENRRIPAFASPLSVNAARDISGVLTRLLADMFALYVKTRNFDKHAVGPQFRDCRLMLGEQAGQIMAMTDAIAERVRKIGGTTIRSIGHIARLQRVADNDSGHMAPLAMLVELRENNIQLAARLRDAHGLCDEHGDIATAGLLKTWIDEAEGRVWFLFETSRRSDPRRPAHYRA